MSFLTDAHAADVFPKKDAPETPSASDPWNGFYFGGHMGRAGGKSNWSGPDIWDSSGLAKQIDTFTEAGSFLGGFQGGYNLLLPSHALLGVEGDFSFPAYPDLSGQSTGVTANFNSLSLGPATYMESVQAAMSLRGRVGYVFDNNWLLFATGGGAWTRNSQTLTAALGGTTDNPFFWRSGWTVGGGIEVPLIPSWTARLEYLYAYFGTKPVNFLANGETFRSDFAPQVLRFALNYHFGDTLPVPAVGVHLIVGNRRFAAGLDILFKNLIICARLLHVI